jgi:hypothetical protein
MKRSLTLLLVFLNLGACSGGGTPPVTPGPDDGKSGAPASTDTTAVGAAPTPSAVASAEPTAAPAATPTATASGTKTTMAVTPGNIPSATPAAELGPEGVPPLSKTQKGLLHTQLAGTDMVFITVMDAGATCATDLKSAAKGDRRVEVRTPWKTGFFTMTSRNSSIRFDQYQGTWQKGEASGDGGVQVRTAPAAQGSTGRIHVKAKRGADEVDAELEVVVCTAFTPPKPKK